LGKIIFDIYLPRGKLQFVNVYFRAFIEQFLGDFLLAL
jgi:hypothetical protein